jgi:hypothetical protein
LLIFCVKNTVQQTDDRLSVWNAMSAVVTKFCASSAHKKTGTSPGGRFCRRKTARCQMYLKASWAVLPISSHSSRGKLRIMTAPLRVTFHIMWIHAPFW